MKRIAAAILLLPALFALAACAGLLTSDQPPVRVYDLEPFTSEVAANAGGNTRLAVQVRAVPGLDTDRLLTLDDDGGVSRIAGARWPDYLPEFVASLLQRSLAATGRYRQVSADPARASHDCLLALSLQRFHVRLDAERRPTAVEVIMRGALECAEFETNVMLEHRAVTAGSRTADVISAYQQALDAITASLLSQLPAGSGQ